MSFSLCKKGALEYWVCDGLRGTVHGFSTRLGGVSQGYLSSMNLGAHRGDAPENVVKNYEILGNSLGFSPEDTVFAKQLHTGIVRRVGRADRGAGLFRPVEEPRDGLVTNEPGVALTIAVRNFMENDYIAGLVRLTDAVLVAGCIAVGVGSVLTVWNHVLGGIAL